MRSRIVLHVTALVAFNLVAIYCGTRWDEWMHHRHPFAAQIPLGALLVILGFPLWYLVSNALDACRWQLETPRTWRTSWIAALILGTSLFALLQPALFGRISVGRSLTFLLFQAICSAIAIGLVFPLRSYDSATFIRSWLANVWVGRLLKLIGAIVVSVIFLVGIESLFFVLNRMQPPGPQKTWEGGYMTPGEFTQPSDMLGRALLPNRNVRCKLKVDEKVVWDVRYSTDNHGRRTSIRTAATPAEQFAVFFGCSYMFGEGANDDQTIPSEFSAAAPQFQSYNYGMPGYGTQQMLAKLESGTLPSEIDQKDGIVVYLYLEDIHEPRVIGDMQLSTRFARFHPYYVLNDEGVPERNGSFTTGRPWVTQGYQLLSKSQFVKYFGINLPKPDESHTLLLAKIIERSRDLVLQQLGTERFFVVIYPRRNAHRTIVPMLEAAGITVLDYTTLFDPSAAGLYHVGDGHPSPAANKLLSTKLAEDISSLRDE